MNDKFTPGPWHVMEGTFGKRHDPKSATVYAAHDDLVYVARCDGSQMMFHDEINALANARLISAAPDLLQALRVAALVLSGDEMTKGRLIQALEMAKSAITKAVAEQI